MYVVREVRNWRPYLLFAYSFDGTAVQIDMTRGDAEFRDGVINHGVPVVDDNLVAVRRVFPSEGKAFHDACCAVFCTGDQTLADEDRLEAMRGKIAAAMASGVRNSDFPPPSINAA